jgi:hypothetical protein
VDHKEHQTKGLLLWYIYIYIYIRNGYNGESRRWQTSNNGCGNKGTMMGGSWGSMLMAV